MSFLWWALIITVIVAAIMIVLLGIPRRITTSTIPPTSCTKLLSELPDVSDTSRFEPCYLFNSNSQNNSSYYDKKNDWTVSLFSSPEAVPPASQVCLEFCQQVQLSSDNSQIQCVGQDEKYHACLDALFPVKCTDPAVPVARSGSSLYYAIGRGKVLCYPPLTKTRII